MNRCRWLLAFGLEIAPAISVPVVMKREGSFCPRNGPELDFSKYKWTFSQSDRMVFLPPPWYLSNMVLLERPFATAKLYGLKSWKNTRTSPTQALGNWPDMSEVGAGQCEGICEYASFNDCCLNSNCCINFENGTQYMFLHVSCFPSGEKDTGEKESALGFFLRAWCLISRPLNESAVHLKPKLCVIFKHTSSLPCLQKKREVLMYIQPPDGGNPLSRTMQIILQKKQQMPLDERSTIVIKTSACLDPPGLSG
jgi:hypothetical protein